MNWARVPGIVVEGHGVASGISGDPRFPEGTIPLQKPCFKARGLDLEPYYPATLNVSIAPCRYTVKRARYTFRNVKWTDVFPPEDFSFFDCKVIPEHGIARQGLIYYPHPDTKPEHFQSPDVLEIITSYIPNLEYGDRLILELPRDQIAIERRD